MTTFLFQGLHQYLHRHQYGNTVTTDLWAALSESSGKPVQSWMESWTRQTGFPLITVTENGGLKLRQNRFLSSGPPAPENDQQLWWVPINASQGRGAEGVTELPLFVLKVRGVREFSFWTFWLVCMLCGQKLLLRLPT